MRSQLSVPELPPPLAPLVGLLSPRVIAAIDRALAKQAAQRFADMGEFILALTGRPLGITATSKESAPPALGTLDTALVATASSPAQRAAGLPTLPAGIEVLPTVAAPAALPTRGRRKLVWAAAGFLACALGVGLFFLRGKADNPPVDEGASSRPQKKVATSRPASPDAGALAHPMIFDAATMAEDARSERIPVVPGPRGKHAAKEEWPHPSARTSCVHARLRGWTFSEVSQSRRSAVEQRQVREA